MSEWNESRFSSAERIQLEIFYDAIDLLATKLTNLKIKVQAHDYDHKRSPLAKVLKLLK